MTDPAPVLRACCGPGMARAEAAGQPVAVFFDAPKGNAVGPVVHDILPAPTSPKAAVHEAAHAVVALIHGASVSRVTIKGQPAAVIDDTGLPPAFRAAIDLAGPAAQAWEARHIHRRSDAEWMCFVPGVRCGTAGGCDFCRAVRNGVAATRWGEDREVVDWLRAVEGVVVEIVRSPFIWRAIDEIAGRLREVGEVSGDEVAAVVAARVPAAEILEWKRRLSDGHH